MPKATEKPKKKHSFWKFCIGCSSIFVFLFLALGGWLYADDRISSNLYLTDQQLIEKYPPSAQAAEIAQTTTMTERGEAMWYSAQPELKKGDDYRDKCGKNLEGGSLGCAYSAMGRIKGKLGSDVTIDDSRIYILDMSEFGIYDSYYITSAHEMLHHAWFRLSSEEKDRLTTLLKEEFAKREKSDEPEDRALVSTMDIYERDGFDIINELHSFLGTEYTDLSPELEEYYEQYFTDREALLELEENDWFASRYKRQQEIANRLNQLDAEIRATVDRANNCADRPCFDREVAKYNRLKAEWDTLYAEYQRIGKELEEVRKYVDPDYKPIGELGAKL